MAKKEKQARNKGKQKDKTMRRMSILLFASLLLLFGMLIILRPTLKDKQRDGAMDDIMKQIESGITEIEVDTNAIAVDGEEWDDEAFQDVFSLNDNALAGLPDKSTIELLGILEIDKIDLRIPLVEGAQKIPLRYGAGRLSASAKLGKPGTCAIFGHRMYEYGRLFNRLGEVEAGDEIVINTVAQEQYIYKVSDVEIVKPGDLIRELFSKKEGTWVALVTCHPVRVASHRMIVWAEEVSKGEKP